MLQEFKKFALKGNVIDLAIGVIIGAAFSKIVTSLVNDLMMPIIGFLVGGIDLTRFSYTFGTAVLKYGAFLQTILDFVITSASIFLFIKGISKLQRKKEEKTVEEPVVPSKEEVLLTEIRDLLKQQQKGV
ncbi:MAG TPA: large conductance mechanosensitive channel protein MscL [Candidatus Bathyarchaeia archaeon]|nr:large conductance mechanosensitive channel protein MscL [Candidatus Bathyarchaeia archaeon]